MRDILIVDDEPDVRAGLVQLLRGGGYATEEATSAEELRQRLKLSAPTVVLLDLHIPGSREFELLDEVLGQWRETPVVVTACSVSIQGVVEAMRRGAFGYLKKPLQRDELLASLAKAAETGHLRRRARTCCQRGRRLFGFDSFVAQSAAMRETLEQAQTVASSPASTVLLLGESGTGKGVLARAIHYGSPRAAEPFLTLTCSAVPEHLLEAELFGHERGAFTDAKARRQGIFEAADGGTVFLDEIGDMPLSLQAKLLGVLEERTFRRIGGNRTLHVDVRIIAATHRDLDTAVAEGRFREDLLYRLRVVPLVIRPLRERVEDIVPLAEAFLQRFNVEFRKRVRKLDAGARSLLRSQPWSGNVRELRNVIERAMLFARTTVLRAKDLLLDTGLPKAATPPEAEVREESALFVLPPGGVRLDQLEQELVRQAMRRAGGVKSRAAGYLGLSRDQIRRRLLRMERGAS